MPIFQKATTRIKELILVAFLSSESIISLRLKIDGIIKWVGSNIPSNLHDKNAYIKGLKLKSEQFIQNYYKRLSKPFIKAQNQVYQIAKREGIPLPKIKTPLELNDEIRTSHKAMWTEAKGNPNVKNYQQELKKAIEKLSEEPITTYEKGKKPISLWQKAELDVRYESQMDQLEALKSEGVQLAWLSSHPNCSKRCECWQGELVSLTKHAKAPQKTVDKKWHYKKSSFVVGEVEGHKVYSLPDIMDVVGPYGYQNNIYNGYNCRHRLYPFKPGQFGPKDYSAEDVAKEREIDQQMREMEREIRKLKTKEILYSKINDVSSAKECRKQWKALFEHYKWFCESNGYAWYAYRINVV